MALGDFLGGGALGFVIVLVAVFIFWILYKIILAPIFGLFGWGKKNLGGLADLIGKMKIANSPEEEEKNLAEEQTIITQGLALLNGLEKNIDSKVDILNRAEKKGALNEFEVTIIRAEFDSQENFFINPMKHSLIILKEKFQKDQKSLDARIKEIKETLEYLKRMKNLAQNRISFAVKNQAVELATNFQGMVLLIDNMSKIIELVDVYESKIKTDLSEQERLIKIIETEMPQAEKLVASGKNLTIEITVQKIPEIRQILLQLKELIKRINPLNETAKSLLKERESFAKSLSKEYFTFINDAKELKKRVDASQFQINELVKNHVITLKTAKEANK